MITTVAGKKVDFGNGQKYFKAADMASNKSVVYTDFTVQGRTFPGPAVYPAEWAKIVKAQALIKKWSEADAKATKYYKQSRYWIVNGGACEARIEKSIERMSAWEEKREAAWIALEKIGVTFF
jgi:hypothetical protein